MHKLSIVLITHNEESRIKKTLEAAKWCDELIIVDSGSTDNTLEICKQFSNCKIYHHPFSGYGEQKKKAVDLSSNKWVLSIDSDEIISSELKNEIETILKKATIPQTHFYIPITLVFLGKIFSYGRMNKRNHLRFFNKEFGNFNANKVHEGLNITGDSSKLKGELLHYSYKNVHHYFEKFNSYTSTGAEVMIKKKRSVNKVLTMILFPFNFFKFYIIDLNFMNGYEGYVWSIFSAFYKIVKYVKYDELLTNK